MGDIAEVVGGGTPRTNEPANFDGGDIPWVTPADLSGYSDKYLSHGSRFITRRGFESSAARLLPAGTVLFSSRAPIGYAAIARNPIATNQGFKSFVLKDGVLPEYVYWWLKGSKQIAESLASGTTFLELSSANAKKIPIPLAPPERQREIVAEIEKQFSRLDEALANLKRVGASLKAYKGAVLAEATHIDQESLPTGWQSSTVGEIAEVGTGATPRRERTEYWRDGTVPWVASAVVKEVIVTKPTELITELALKETNCRLYPPGTLLIAMYGEGKTRGMCAELGIRAATNQALAAIQAPVELRHYLKLVLQASYDRTRRSASGGVQPNLNLSHVRAIRVPLPPLEERRRIVADVARHVSIADDLASQMRVHLTRAERLRRTLLLNAFQANKLYSERSTFLANLKSSHL